MSTVTPLPIRPAKTSVGNHFVSNYPPFSVWSPEAIPGFRAHLEQVVPAHQPISLYVHVPFCRQRCHYCYFRVYPRRDKAEVARYFADVLREFAIYQRQPAIAGRPFHSIYFGGGTPSYPATAQIREVLETLLAGHSDEALEEFTFECEPGTISAEKFRMLKELGVTRVSLGFQTLNEEVLRRSGRDLTKEDCLSAYKQARAAGFDQINVDLLAGLPGETESTWKATIESVAELEPECVTIYQLELTHNSGLFRSMEAGREVDLADWPTKRRWVREAFERLEEFGYTVASGYMAVRDRQRWRFAYTVDHFWQGHDLLALGESSFGHIQGTHYQNARTFNRYTSMLARGELPLRRAYQLRPEEKWRRELILQLKTGAVRAEYFRQKFEVEIVQAFREELEDLRRQGWLEFDHEGIHLTRSGLLDVDWLLPVFYLPEHRGIRYT